MGLQILQLRNNHAQIGSWLWFTSSLIILIPFSVFASLGNRLEWSKNSRKAEFSFIGRLQEVGRPFAAAKPVSTIESARSSVAAALQEQLGLELSSSHRSSFRSGR